MSDTTNAPDSARVQDLDERVNASHTTLAGAAMPLGAVVGVFDRVYPNWLDDEVRHSVIAFGFIMLFAAGGILYLTFQDIAPQARVDNRMAPAFGAVVGFLLGLVGEMLLIR